jgi:hypothetical protein
LSNNQQVLHFIPHHARDRVVDLLDKDGLVVKVKQERKTKHGDYRSLHNGMHQITINANLNPYRFLITLIHEIAHFEAYQNYGYRIKPHGKEWKQTFQHIMLPFISPDIFPNELLPLLARHFINPKASTDTDAQLSLALKQYNEGEAKTYVFELPLGQKFKIYNGRTFKRGRKRRKRYECMELKTNKVYLFNPNVEVEALN